MNYKKIPVTVLLVLAAALSMAPRSQAASLEDAQMKLAGAIGLSARSNSADSGEGVMNVQYIGTGSDPIVTITSTAMTFYSAAGVPDTTIGTAGVVTFASTAGCSTLGGLCDYIEARTNYRCRLTGGKRDDLPILLRDQTATTAVRRLSGDGQNLQLEGASAGGDGSAYAIRQGFTPPSGKRVVLRKCTTITNAVGTLLVYGKTAALANNILNLGSATPPIRNDSTLVWSEPTESATSLTEDWTTTNGGVGGGIEFATDEHVVVSAGNVATVQLAADFLQCSVEFR